ncbi:segregation and condensation protein A [Candidatus Contubernalis alkaliaceticus]|uniref:segregation and condensation protein A n=1 Tax=Candidatus Contubernalis alkaliaceticus TaxID=338645 RepID=UPI001F4C0300|nr:segregation/condensation protein A [Candidatus Contubernalis alkalaceticus]UNC92510.1 segregation/condensation protein A [Candidatus Contubernalis alkalaceticus]
MTYRVKTSFFEGPFDLLLHLVKKAELDIYEISVKEIVQQYLEYVKRIQEFNTELAGDFLVMAATLLKLKSQKILPEAEEEDELMDEEILYSSEQELFQRLAEYRVFKEKAEQFKILEEQEQKHYSRYLEDSPQEESFQVEEFENMLSKVTLGDLRDVLEAVLNKMEEEDPEVILPQEISLTEKMAEILNYLSLNHGKAKIQDLFESQRRRPALIVTFLAVLVLMKLRKISVHQQYTFGPILLEYRGEAIDGGEEERWEESG